jgi:hypothetical protein
VQVGKIPSRPKRSDVSYREFRHQSGSFALGIGTRGQKSVGLDLHSAHACMVGYPPRSVKWHSAGSIRQPIWQRKRDRGWFFELVTVELEAFALHLG